MSQGPVRRDTAVPMGELRYRRGDVCYAACITNKGRPITN